ncbi:MAG: response regulator transcription factor [Defluviitaleaceae bacterium]|nr:response regulator transcription factor [Defluviitaleaceae bacterium]
MIKPQTILICEDEKDIAGGIAKGLKREGYETIHAENGEAGVAVVKRGGIDLVLMDVMMPDSDGDKDVMAGIYAAEEIRKFSQVPIIFLTGKDSEGDKLDGFRAGGDDYIVKPHSLRELAARVKAVLNRTSSPQPTPSTNTYKTGNLSLDVDRWLVTVDGEEKHLTPTEKKILRYLLINIDCPLSYEQIYNTAIDEHGYGDIENNIRQHIKNIRNKIEPDPTNPIYIKNERSLGYKAVTLPRV